MRRAFITSLTAGVLGLALLAVPASAATETLTGKGSKDPAVKFEMDVEAKVKKGTATATTITRISMSNAKFVCKPTGDPSGRSDYFNYPEDLKIKKSGRFKDVDENKASGHVLTRYTLEGKATGKGRKLTVEGTFRAELSEGGLEFSNCDTGPVAFKLKARL